MTKILQLHKLRPTSMEPATTAAPIQRRPRLTTLPRETRNQIYRYVIVSSKPIKVCYDYELLRLYLRAGRRNQDVSIEFLCHAVEGSKLAQEIYEEFFRNNIFDCTCQDLRRFLTTTTTRFDFKNNLVPTASNHGYLKFEKNPWIRKVRVSIFTDVFECKPSEHLAYLLRCPHLQQVEITVFGLPRRSNEIDPVDRTIEAVARVCKSIRGEVGGGLTLRVQKGWMPITPLIINNIVLEDVSWMWEEPGKETRGRLGTGFGRNEEKIQLLMSTGWPGQKGKVGAWAEHWRQEHIDQQRLREL